MAAAATWAPAASSATSMAVSVMAASMASPADGSGRLMGAGTLAAARTGQGRCTDLVLGIPMDWGLGFALSGPEGHFGPNPAAFGHDGAGGSAVCADPEAGFAFSYVMNGMAWSLVDDQRKMTLLDAVYASVR